MYVMEKENPIITHAKVVGAMMKREVMEFDKKLDYWKSKKGRRVKHQAYLLIGTITGTMVVPVSSQPRIVVKWNNGAETSELPHAIKLLTLKRRKKR